MKSSFWAVIGYDAPTRERPNAVHRYGHLDVIATSEEEARILVEQHLAEGKALGFTEREIRKKYPKRTPWRPGLRVLYFFTSHPVDDNRKTGVVFDEEHDPQIPF
jgi:hypothetical protein